MEAQKTNEEIVEEFESIYRGSLLRGSDVSEWLRHALTLKDEAHKKEMEEAMMSKNNAYQERDMLVCALSKLFPAYLARHNEKDVMWDRDWMWIVYIDLPAGQVSWHIHDSEREMFNHLDVKENNWDGHNTERKYQRLQLLHALTPTKEVTDGYEEERHKGMSEYTRLRRY